MVSYNIFIDVSEFNLYPKIIVWLLIYYQSTIGENGYDYHFTRTLSSDTDSDAGYGTSSFSNDNSNTSSVSVTRSNSTDLQDIQSPTEGQNATPGNRNVAEDNYATGQNLDMDWLSELLVR